MKKLIFTGFAVLFALALITCDMMPVPLGGEGELGFTDVVYSPDGTSLTLYLEGGVMESATSRALSHQLAERGHDFYEVVFFNGEADPADQIVARASWERGNSAAVRNVPRNINYGTADKAILFVGSSVDRTLLAVGLLTATDTGGTTVTAETTSVTFSIVALNGGAERVTGLVSGNTDVPSTDYDDDDDEEFEFTATSSTFLTSHNGTVFAPSRTGDGSGDPYAYLGARAENTKIGIVSIDKDIEFPIYLLNLNETRAATYTINFVNRAGDIEEDPSDYLDGIMLNDTVSVDPILNIVPARFPAGGGRYNYITPSIIGYDVRATYKNTYAATPSGSTVYDALGPTFNNVIMMTITTPDLAIADGGVFSLGFEIPVFAITKANTPAGVAPSKIWYIRPAVGTENLNLDNGLRGPGGQILIGVGDVDFNSIVIDTRSP